MPEISLPASLQGVEPVRSVRTPARLDYEFTAGDASSRFLKGITQKKIIGQRANPESRVYVPPRGPVKHCPEGAGGSPFCKGDIQVRAWLSAKL